MSWLSLKPTRVIACVLVSLCLVSCSSKPATVIAEINFANAELPDSVAEISGFSDRESWGRWSDANIAPTAKIRFKQPLPTQFSITITGQTVEGNEYSIVKIGTFQEQFHLQKLKDVVVVDVTLDKSENTIEFIPAAPIAPKKLRLNEDTRKLGVGLATLLIEK